MRLNKIFLFCFLIIVIFLTQKVQAATTIGDNISSGGSLSVTGAATLQSTLGVAGDFAVNTNKFQVTASTGNIQVAGQATTTGMAYFTGGIEVNASSTIGINTATTTLAGGVEATKDLRVSSSTADNACAALYVDASSGRVGIATTSPEHQLAVGGDLKVSGNAAFGNTAEVATGSFYNSSTAVVPKVSSVNIITDTSNREVGIWSQLFLQNTASNPKIKYGILGNVEVSASTTQNTTASLRGIQGAVDHMGWGTITTSYGGIFFAENTAGGTMTETFGVMGRVINASTATGTISSAYGMASLLSNNNSQGTISNAYGLYSDIDNSGTINTAYGLYIEDLQGTRQWGIYQVGSTDNNYFAGKMGIGTSTPDWPIQTGDHSSGTYFSVDTSGNATTSGRLNVDGNASSSGTYILAGNKLTGLLEKCFAYASTTFDEFDNLPLWHPYQAITVREERCMSTGGTSVQVTLSDGTNNMDQLTCATSLTKDSALSNNSWSADELMEIDFGTNTGASDWVEVCIIYALQ